MYRLFEFIKRTYVVLLFLLLEAVALNRYASSTAYTQAKILSRTSAVTGAVDGAVSGVKHYFSLSEENRLLTRRLAMTEARLAAMRESEQGAAMISIDDLLLPDTLVPEWSQYQFHTARVVASSTDRPRNFVVLNRGIADGIREDMAVVTPDMKLVGYIVSCSERYSVVLPLLNTTFRTGGRLASGNHYGSISWDGLSPYRITLGELSKYADIDRGVPVMVYSERFPEGILVGYVEEYALNSAQTAYTATVSVAADMSSLYNVIIIENTHYGEIEALIDDADKRF